MHLFVKTKYKKMFKLHWLFLLSLLLILTAVNARNLLLLSHSFPGHLKTIVELADTLLQNPENKNITIITQRWGLFSDYRLEKWYNERITNNKRVHIAILKDDTLSIRNLPDYNTLMERMNFIHDELESNLYVAKQYFAPHEKLLLSNLEFISYNNTQEGIQIQQQKRKIKIKGDPSNTIFDSISMDFSLFAIASIAAEYNIPCSRIFTSVMLHNPFHYPRLLLKKLSDLTYFSSRIQIPFVMAKEITYFYHYFDIISGWDMGSFFAKNTNDKNIVLFPRVTLNGFSLLEWKCARIQTSSLGVEYGSASTQQLNTFLVGPFVNKESVEEEKKQMNEMSRDITRKDSHGGFYGLQEWIVNQKRMVLVILGSTTVLNEKSMKKLVNAMDWIVHHNNEMNLSVLISLSEKNLKLFDQVSSITLRNHSRFRLLKGYVPQKALMSLENVEIFISHCGGNSVHEALYFGKMIIGLPFTLDQFRMTGIIEDAQVGIPLYTKASDRDNDSVWNETNIVKAVQTLLDSDSPNAKINYKQKVKRAMILLRNAGGVRRASQIVEMITDLEGDLEWTEITTHLSFWQYYCLDIILFYGIVTLVIGKMIILIIEKMFLQRKSNSLGFISFERKYGALLQKLNGLFKKNS